MTKAVRIENADTSDWQIIIEVWEKGLNSAPDIHANTLSNVHDRSVYSEHPVSYCTGSNSRRDTNIKGEGK